jgi:hypothetical protein
MAVVVADIKKDILDLFDIMDSAPTSKEAQAQAWASLIAKHIKTAQVPAGAFLVEAEEGVPSTSPVNVE